MAFVHLFATPADAPQSPATAFALASLHRLLLHPEAVAVRQSATVGVEALRTVDLIPAGRFAAPGSRF